MTQIIPYPSKPVWDGPYPTTDPKLNLRRGVTQSLLIRFMECPFRFFLYAFCGFQEPKPPHENLVWGSMMHKGLEHLIRGDSLAQSIQAIYDYYQQEHPTSPEENLYTCYEMLKLYPLDKFKHWNNPITEYKLVLPITVTQDPLRLSLPDPLGSPDLLTGPQQDVLIQREPREVLIRGMADVTDFTRLCDHKCKGRIYPQETAEELGEDFQMNIYTYALKTYEWQYDLIQCPLGAYRAPEKRGLETAQAYANRIFHEHTDSAWNWPVSRHLYNWICCIPYHTTPERNEYYYQTTIQPWINRLCDWWDLVTSPSFDPNDPACYNTIFYRNPARVFDPSRTDKFKPHFHGILTDTDTFDSLIKVKSFYPELE